MRLATAKEIRGTGAKATRDFLVLPVIGYESPEAFVTVNTSTSGVGVEISGTSPYSGF